MEQIISFYWKGEIPEKWFYWQFTWFIFSRICFQFKILQEERQIFQQLQWSGKALNADSMGGGDCPVLCLFAATSVCLGKLIQIHSVLHLGKYGEENSLYSLSASSPQSDWLKMKQYSAESHLFTDFTKQIEKFKQFKNSVLNVTLHSFTLCQAKLNHWKEKLRFC